MTTSESLGSDTEMSRRLCSRAPETTMQFLVGGIQGAVYGREQTFARIGVRTLRRSHQDDAGCVSLVTLGHRAERRERRLVGEPAARKDRPQARVVERVLRVAVDRRPRVPEDPPEPERPPRAHVQRVRLAQPLGLPALRRLPVLRQRGLAALRRRPRQLGQPDRLAAGAAVVLYPSVLAPGLFPFFRPPPP